MISSAVLALLQRQNGSARRLQLSLGTYAKPISSTTLHSQAETTDEVAAPVERLQVPVKQQTQKKEKQEKQQQQQQQQGQQQKQKLQQQQLQGDASSSSSSSSREVQLKGLVARYLLQQPSYTATLSSTGMHLAAMEHTRKKLGLSGTLKAVLKRDPSGAFGLGTETSKVLQVQLREAELLHYVQEQCGVVEPQSLQAAVDVVWPIQHLEQVPPAQQQQQQQQQQKQMALPSSPQLPQQQQQQEEPLEWEQPGQQMQQQQQKEEDLLGLDQLGQQLEQQQAAPLPPVSQLLFELQLQDGLGWVQPTFILHPEQQQLKPQPRRLLFSQQQQQQPLEHLPLEETEADAVAVAIQQLVGVTRGGARLAPFDASLSDHSSDGGDRLGWAVGGDTSGADEPYASSTSSSCWLDAAKPGVDEAVWSMSRLLPERLGADLQPYMSLDVSPSLEEVIIDKNRKVELRLSDRSSVHLPYTVSIVEPLAMLEAAQQQWTLEGRISTDDEDSAGSQQQQQQQQFADLTFAGQAAQYRHAREFGSLFRHDGRMGVPGTLHRISVIRNASGTPTGLTYRLGRHVPDKARLIADQLSAMKASIMPGTPAERAQSLLVLGKPGTGKTTLLRDIARIMSTPPEQGGLGMAVIIVDTSNEIAGDADESHPCIGYARRLMVPRRDQQADILVQAVQNHNPDVIIVDEIGTKQEVAAARTIAERGVVLVGTAHGNNLSNLIRNPELRPLVGGVMAVTLGDEMARATNGSIKTRLERAGAATFVSLLELDSRHTWRLHLDVEQSADLLLGSASDSTAALDPTSKLDGTITAAAGARSISRVSVNTQVRSKGSDGRLWVQFETAGAAEQTLAAARVVQQLSGDALCA